MSHRIYLKYVIVILGVVLVGKLIQDNVLFHKDNKQYASRCQKVYLDKERELTSIVSDVSFALRRGAKGINAYDTRFSKYIDLLDHRGLALFIYENDTLRFWSDNEAPVGNIFSKSGIGKAILFLPNGRYMPIISKVPGFVVVGLVQIKKSYQYENKYLTGEFQQDFKLPFSVRLSEHPVKGSAPILDSKNHYLFSLIFSSSPQSALLLYYIPSLLYFLALVLALFFVYKLVRDVSPERKRNTTIALVSLLLIGIRFVALKWQLPRTFSELDLFKPQLFASSWLVPSLGDLLLWAVCIFFIILLFYRCFKIKAEIPRKNWHLLSLAAGLILVVWVMFSGIIYLIQNIILNSTISFEINKLLLFDIYSFIGYVVIMLLLVSLAFILDRIISLFVNRMSFNEFSYIILSVSIVWIITLVVTGNTVYAESVLFVVIVCLIMSYVRLKLTAGYNYSVLILLTAIFALYTVFVVTKFSSVRNLNQKKVLVTNLSNEHDPVAEYILREVNGTIGMDTTLIGLIRKKVPDNNKIYEHLKRNYFGSYLERYNLEQFPICSPSDSIYLEPPDNTYADCYKFFRGIIKEKGTKIPETNFYYIDNANGRISYMGWFEFNAPGWAHPISIFIEIASKLASEKLGYPELLLDNRFSSFAKAKDFSYAKYYKGKLISQSGSFSYNLSSSLFEKCKREYFQLRMGGYDHLVYRVNRESLMVLSLPLVSFLDLTVSFSYTFVLYFMVLTLIILLNNLSMIRNSFIPNFKNKIQYSMMAVLFLSLMLIGGGTIYFNVRQYKRANHQQLSEKLQSVYIELTHRLVQEQKIGPSIYLNELLINLSNVFYSDINLYDPNGNLIATSRPEIFNKGLVGTKINPIVFSRLASETKAEVVHNERIGNLKYISAYAPFNNKDNKLLAYLNLPYFTRQEELAREVSTMVVAAVNVYVILLLITILIAVFISRKITMPLQVIQKKFSEIKLGQQYEKIEYNSNDEIGGLVNEYNRMVSELEKSIEMLAKSERESAWREMAKQIAHEINNPLTPMKLSVQHLQRAWSDKNERFEEYLNRISRTLIDEIDTLSAIASEFSNFAKMPNAISDKLDLVAKINNIVTLFDSDEAEFVIHSPDYEVFVYADKEQISRVFINLFKNAVQSVDKDVRPVIIVSVTVSNQMVEVHVKDNGKGIPKEMRKKIFSPNFTTKTSGMGLGLAIVKSIVTSAGGTITYETEENKGTSFIIRLPVYDK
ncbi:MAG: ATP-binding protein [Bacteroidota bacterium]|nr:ATP-binding protein [Bacteroidota bacterium]